MFSSSSSVPTRDSPLKSWIIQLNPVYFFSPVESTLPVLAFPVENYEMQKFCGRERKFHSKWWEMGMKMWKREREWEFLYRNGSGWESKLIPVDLYLARLCPNSITSILLKTCLKPGFRLGLRHVLSRWQTSQRPTKSRTCFRPDRSMFLAVTRAQ